MMNKKRLFQKTVLAAAITLTTQQAVAAGFQLNAQSATGLGRAFAGDAVIADNASVMARNPAAMALFDEMSMSLGFVMIDTQIEVKDGKYTNNVTGQTNVDSSYSEAGDTSFAPNIHLVVPVNDKLAWGVNLYSNFGTKTEFDNATFTGTEYGGLTDVKSMNLGTSLSYRLNEQWSIGGGLDLIYGEGKLERELMGTSAVKADADGFAVGFNIGAVYELDEDNRFGASYRYSPELEADGTVNGKDDTLLMPLPDMAEISGYHRLDPKYAVHYSVQWIGWSSFDTLDTKNTGTLNTYKWQNGMHYSIGGTYYLDQSWELRAGYMYDTSAQDQVTSISVPDSDRQWFSAGFSYHIDDKSTVDFGATYLVGEDVNVNEVTYVPGSNNSVELSSISATTRANAVLLGLQYSRSF